MCISLTLLLPATLLHSTPLYATPHISSILYCALLLHIILSYSTPLYSPPLHPTPLYSTLHYPICLHLPPRSLLLPRRVVKNRCALWVLSARCPGAVLSGLCRRTVRVLYGCPMGCRLGAVYVPMLAVGVLSGVLSVCCIREWLSALWGPCFETASAL